MLTARDIANDCLAHINQQLSASTPFSGLPVGCEGYLVRTLNTALEEMLTLAPAMFRRTIGVVFEAPITGAVSVEQGSASVYLGDIDEPANGCTILIDGDPIHNEVRANASELGDWLLNHAYGGTTGAQNATIWGDSVVIPTTVSRIFGGISLVDRRPLSVVNSRQDLMQWRRRGMRDYGASSGATPPPQRSPGVPEAVWLETYFEPDSAEIEYRIRCSPMPDAQYAVDLEVMTIPTEVTSADLNDGAVFTFVVPGKRAHTIFRALALYHWSFSPWFADDKSRPGINAAYTLARQQLEDFHPGGSAGVIIVEGN